LEASPNYTKHFIAKKQPFFYIFKIGIIGMGSILKAIVGVIRIKIIRINAIRI
jgi:hypothetical protein